MSIIVDLNVGRAVRARQERNHTVGVILVGMIVTPDQGGLTVPAVHYYYKLDINRLYMVDMDIIMS